jgi:formate dehydrogenase major subunit
MPRAIIDGNEVAASAGQTILEVCREAGIPIPTLCHDDRLKPLGSCQMCVVDVQGHGLTSSCATPVADGMVIESGNARVRAARRQTLESLLADHYGDCVSPCQAACPAGIDVQGYISLIAKGAYGAAVNLIKESLPLPAIIGRICPHPCEKACRRNLVDEPIAICSLKRFAADSETDAGRMPAPSRKPKTGFRVAIVGSGPAGLSAAYYLTREGHEVTIIEALPEPGGMLRYGIPDYRLPRDILDGEIAGITGLGVEIKTGKALGKDFTTKSLRDEGFNAVFLAIGAHESTKMRVEGEDLAGVFPGTDFLRNFTLGEKADLGRRVCVIGGGNTAIDAARTALRLGPEEVTILYRRSRAEMPASDWEIEEAEEEGVHIRLLAAPVRILGDNVRVQAIECIRMKLGEPDSSGRRRPEPIPGSEFTLPTDSVIAAIGQRPDLSAVAEEGDLKTEWGNIVVDSDTASTLEGVFAGGDCVTGAATAVEAIAAGRKAAHAMDRYLRGEGAEEAAGMFEIGKGSLEELDGRPEFREAERLPRSRMPVLRPDERKTDFRQIELGYPEEAARREAERCLECGCKAATDCALRQLPDEYEVPSMIANEGARRFDLDRSHPFIERDPNKCIACERCARVCLDVRGIGALSMDYRVGTTEGYGGSLLNTTCVTCGHCVASCPVGALVAKKELTPEREVRTTCPYCGVGCGLLLGVREGTIVSVRGNADSAVNWGDLCVKGRFGLDFVNSPERLTSPLIRKDGDLVEATWDEALGMVASRLSGYEPDQLAVVSSARATNEENYVVQKLTRAVLGTNSIDHCARL